MIKMGVLISDPQCIGLCLDRYFQAGGSPEHVIQLLSENYSAVAQTVNLLAEWLIQMGKSANCASV